MKLTHQAHFEAAKELIELMSIAGWLALLADLFWVIRDSMLNGWPTSLVPVIVLLTIGFIIMSYGVYKYHKEQHSKILRDRLHEKLSVYKKKFKRTH